MVVGKHMKGQSCLAQIVQALNALGAGTALAQGGQQQGGQNRDYGYDAEQL